MKATFTLLIIIQLPFIVGIYLPEKNTANFHRTSFNINPEHLDGPFTGGFGEETCHSCHFDYDLNQEGGSLNVKGLEEPYQPGSTYEVTVLVESEHLEIGGFQMTSRFEDGSQAGKFDWESERLTFTPSIHDEVQYLQHSRDGTTPTAERKVSWIFTWEAPENRSDPVIFNIAANAGNNDDSAFGDWIYVKELVSVPKR